MVRATGWRCWMREDSGGGHRLRRQLAAALVGLTLVCALLLSLGFWAVERTIEQTSLITLLDHEMTTLAQAGSVNGAIDLQGETLRYYRPARGGGALPAAMLLLPPGSHDGVLIDGHERYVLVRRIADGDLAYLAYSDDSLQTRERLLLAALFAAVLLIAALGFWVSGRLARQVLAPLDGLVTELHALNPEQRGQRLSPPAADSELAVIADALNRYMTRLDELVERERAFAASASHELRTPLAVIQGAAEVLQQTSASPPVARILRAARSAQHDLDALLWLSRGDAAPQAEVIALQERLQTLCAAQLDINAVQWHLTPCTVTAPPGAVGIIVTNLLRNSLSAMARGGNTPPDGSGVRVTLSADRLTVDDDGPGIPVDELPQVFAPRTRGMDGGTGMGLYIAATLAARLGWTLSLENRAGGGARAVLGFKP